MKKVRQWMIPAMISGMTVLFAGASEVEISVTNRSATDWKADCEVHSVPLGEILIPEECGAVRSVTVLHDGKAVPAQLDDLDGDGTFEADDELCFRIPAALAQGATAKFTAKFSRTPPSESENSDSFTLKKIGNFVKADSSLYTVVFTVDSGTINTLYFDDEDGERTILLKSGLHSPGYSFVGEFQGADGKRVWKDRLMSWECKGILKTMSTGPVRSVVVFDDISCRAKNELNVTDRYQVTYFLYPEGRIVERFAVKPGDETGKSSYQMIFLALSPALPEQTVFRELTAGDAAGKVLEKVEIPEKGDFAYYRPVNTVLSYLAVSNPEAGAAIIVDPKSFQFGKREMNTSDSQYAWNYIGDYRSGQYAWRGNPWSGWQFNLEMSASEWPGRISRGESPLEACFYIWKGAGELEYTARALMRKP